jgi:ATP-dependent protease HslVU (ClpYQ) peptidase subunit
MHSNPARVIVTFCIACGCAVIAHSTAEVAIRTPDEIVIGVDSEVDNAAGVPVRKTCKIRRLGPNIFITMMGMSEDQPTRFDAFDIAEKSSTRTAGSILAKVNAIEAAIDVPLKNALTRIKRDTPKDFQAHAIEKAPVSVIVAGLEKNVLVLYGRTFRVSAIAADETVTLTVDSVECPGRECDHSGGRLRSLGSPIGKPDSDRFERLYPNSWSEPGVTVASNFFEMVKGESGVSSPFDILRITKAGAEWIEPEGCEEQAKDHKSTRPRRTKKHQH